MKKIDPKQSLSAIPFLGPVVFIFLVNIALIVFIYLIHTKLPPELPLLYGMPVGQDQLAVWYSLFILPSLSIAVIIINTFMAYFVKDPFIKKVLIGIGGLFTLLSTITIIKIIFLVGNL